MSDAGIRIAVLDDYQHVAMHSADWSPLEGRADITVFHDHEAGHDALVRRLQPFDAICVMPMRGSGAPAAMASALTAPMPLARITDA